MEYKLRTYPDSGEIMVCQHCSSEVPTGEFKTDRFDQPHLDPISYWCEICASTVGCGRRIITEEVLHSDMCAVANMILIKMEDMGNGRQT